MAVFRKRTHSRFVAWLALAAMWLTVVMPVISRSMPNMPDGVGVMGAMDHGCRGSSHESSKQHHPSTAPDPSSTLDKCGYCGLFCHSPMVAGTSLPPLPPLAFPAATLLSPAVPSGPTPHLLSAPPRGPPSLG